VNTPERILELVRKSLDHGHTVEIDGLGVFRLGSAGYEFTPQTQPQVFVAYVEEDLVAKDLRVAPASGLRALDG
jgi:hypothetical protein